MPQSKSTAAEASGAGTENERDISFGLSLLPRAIGEAPNMRMCEPVTPVRTSSTTSAASGIELKVHNHRRLDHYTNKSDHQS